MSPKKFPIRPIHAILILSGGLILLLYWLALHIEINPVTPTPSTSLPVTKQVTPSSVPTASSPPPSPLATLTTPSVTNSSPPRISWGDTFLLNRDIQEAGNIKESSDPHWWINSGGQFIVQNGVAKTIQSDLASDSEWYKRYQQDNPVDTDNGTHPQNIFRLVQRQTWHNLTQSAYFRINHDNLSSSPNRNESNGLFLMNRYVDGQTLYYTGIRVDGAAVVKKKVNGTYVTLAYKPVFSGSAYNHDTNPNAIPHGSWIGLKAVVNDVTNGTVGIKLYYTAGQSDNWQLLIDVTDTGKTGGAIISAAGNAGIRTDFMDVDFSDYRISEL
jgi:hypothetical protein